MPDYTKMTKKELIAELKSMSAKLNDAQKCILLMTNDGTEIKSQKKEFGNLLKSQEEAYTFFSDLYNTSPIGYIIFCKKGIVLECNVTFANFLGIKQSEIKGKPLLDFIKKKDAQVFKDHLKRCNSSEKKVVSEIAFTTKDGKTMHTQMISDTAKVIKEGIAGYETSVFNLSECISIIRSREKNNEKKVACSYTAIIDVFELIRIEKEILKKHKLLLAIIDGISDAVYLKDVNGKYLIVNLAGAGILGKKVQEVIGQDDTELFPLKIAQYIMDQDHEIMETKKAKTFEENLMLKDGEQTFLTTKSPYFNHSNGKVIGLIGISRNITEYKNVREQFSQSERINSLGHIVAGMAHEINNPIGVIYICAKEHKKHLEDILNDSKKSIQIAKTISENIRQLKKINELDFMNYSENKRDLYLKERRDIIHKLTKSTKTVQENINRIEGNGSHLLRYSDNLLKESFRCKYLISEFLNLARKEEPKKVKINVNSVLKNVLQLFKNRLSNDRIEFRSFFAPNIPGCMADVHQIELVISNIVSNAINAINDSFEVNCVSRKQTKGMLKVNTTFYEDKELLEIGITDTGVGIKKEDLKKIFDPFFSKRKKKEGSGLGLSIAHKLIKSHDGDIKVASKVGKGTTVKIFLPVKDGMR